MGKKKRKHKKHSFKHSAPAASKPVQTAQKQEAAVAAVAESGFNYVARDLKRITFLAAVFVALQIGLWYAFNNTGLGTAVYNLIKI